MDAVSGLFLGALGTDLTAMEEYFPFVSKAFTVIQYTAWAILFLITIWKLFRAFGGPIKDTYGWNQTDEERKKYVLQLHAARIFDNPKWVDYTSFNEKYRKGI